MSTKKLSAIQRLVDHQNGPTKVSQLLGGKPAYQEIQRWLGRGWASPMHILSLKPLLPPGVSIEDLYADRTRVREAVEKATKRARAAPTSRRSAAAAAPA
jgi:hypothetical protein